MVPPDDAISNEKTSGVDYNFALGDRYTKSDGIVYLTGMQALVRLLIEQIDLDRRQGLRTRGYVSGYRGSPVGAFDSAIWQAGEAITDRGIHFNPGINEDLAMTAVGGTQHVVVTDKADLDGVFGIWYGKGPGVDRSVDAIKHASLAGASPHGGMLMLVGDDQLGKSSSLCHQSEQSLVSGNVPILAPSSIHEYVPLGLHAIAMSRYSGVMASMKITSNTADSAATVDLWTFRCRSEATADCCARNHAGRQGWRVAAALTGLEGSGELSRNCGRKRAGLTECRRPALPPVHTSRLHGRFGARWKAAVVRSAAGLNRH